MRPDLEILEERIPLAADTLYLDFNWWGYSVQDEFRFSNKDYPKKRNPYDLNGDQRANLKDYRIFVSKVVQEAEKVLPPEMKVVPVDVFQDEGLGEKIQDEKAGFVVKMGGYTRPFGFGEAWLARKGENISGSAWVYTGNIMEYAWKSRASAATRIRGIANTIAREWGHLAGIGYTNFSPSDIMSGSGFNPFQNYSFQPEHREEILDSIYSDTFSFYPDHPFPID